MSSEVKKNQCTLIFIDLDHAELFAALI